ncbi:LysR family transcriptional regulator [Halopseudomonas maritima]|uniref:LysR family transcriptional regulator n=1 Tax=Halopseudomonas maritima TaxID=2918528 RepID=UPI001EEA67F6|nr:LysR family transcriptional regulator [Halopseudomonas maritima]UJJ30326.1 LysR family transcriptional regulator [Halopseudomonas maritima]
MNKDNVFDHIARLDLNLFRVFAVIYRERNLTRAAERLCISQSAVSHALARMRQQLDDPLFVREAQGVVPTALAMKMWPDIEDGLSFFERAVDRGASFDPARDIEQVILAMNDEIEPILLPVFAAGLQREAPGLRIASVRVNRPTLRADLATGRLDCAIDVAQAAEESLQHAPLTRDEFVVLSSTAAPIDRAAYLAAGHVTVSARRTGRSLEDWELTRQGIERRVLARCQHYQSACHLVAAGDLLLTIPRSLALAANALTGNHIHPLPIAIPAVELHLFWHREREKSPANSWLRNTLLHTLGKGPKS